MRVATLTAIGLGVLIAVPAHAFDPLDATSWTPTYDYPTQYPEEVAPAPDPLLYPGISALAVGVMFVSIAAATDSPSRQPRCGATTCWGRREAVIAAGGAIGAAGVVTLVTAAVRETPAPSGAEARRVAGATLVDMGVGAAGYGVGLVVAHGSGIEDVEAEAGAFIGIGAALALAGAALIVSGEDAQTRRARRTSFRSHGMLGTGIVLTTLGAAGFGASVAFRAAAGSCSGDFCGYAAIVQAATMVPGVAALGVGIPLWITGSRMKTTPDLQWTGDRLTASWRFQ